MTTPRLATYAVSGIAKYGFVTPSGIVDLSARFDYPTLREAIEVGALMKLAEEGAKHSPDHARSLANGAGSGHPISGYPRTGSTTTS